MRRERAFTLIELLVVISIIGLLASIVMASLSSARAKAKIAAGLQFASTVDNAEGDQAIGAWTFSECSGSVANDSSGNGNTGTLIGSPTWSSDTPGGSGCSLALNGSTQYVTIPSSTSLNPSGDMTISIWVKPGSTQVAYADILSKHSPGGYVIEQANVSTNMFYFGWDSTGIGAYPTYTTTAQLTAGVWQNFVAVKSGANVTLYVNGASIASGTGSGAAIVPNNLNLFVGNWSSGGGRTFNGQIDALRMYAKALSASEIHALYAAEAPRYRVAAQSR